MEMNILWMKLKVVIERKSMTKTDNGSKPHRNKV